MLNYENLIGRFEEVIQSKDWSDLQDKFNNSNNIYILGHGGNLAVADHAAADITRLSNGQRLAQAPGSAILATSLINDTDWDQWMVSWLEAFTRNRTDEQIANSLVLGISSSGRSKDIIKALQWANTRGLNVACITSHKLSEKVENCTVVELGAQYYHTAEVLTLLLTYELTHGSGCATPPINQNRPDELKQLNWNKGIRKHSYPDEMINLGIDFDGVIHKNSKGYHDGTIYDDPVTGIENALKTLSEKYTLICYTAKAKPDRGLVNGKTGTQLVWEWLAQHNLDKYISKVTAEKPRAVAYIDDKAFRFNDWDSCLTELKHNGII
jgi:phosphoheptose isomerase